MRDGRSSRRSSALARLKEQAPIPHFFNSAVFRKAFARD